jgi:transcriptional regulator with XRE-family HTH domain
MTINEFQEFQQLRAPDMVALANYVNKAKGPERPMAQFAEDTGIGASTLSRIVNRRITKPLSKEVILKIYECRANPEDEYLLEALARANGLMPPDYAARVQSENRMAAKRNAEISRANMMKNSIVTSILAAGMPISTILDDRMARLEREIPAIFTRYRGDFTVVLRSEESTSGINEWSFFLYPQLLEEDINQRPDRFIVRMLLDKIKSWLLVDAWYPEEMRHMKFTFAFADERLFDAFKEALSVAKLNNEMSVILMDRYDYTVLKEVWLPGNYSPMTNISVFEMPAPGADDRNYDDEDDE